MVLYYRKTSEYLVVFLNLSKIYIKKIHEVIYDQQWNVNKFISYNYTISVNREMKFDKNSRFYETKS